jgi:hypothetical protein
LEVPSRPADAPRQLTRAAGRLWSHRWAALAAATVATVAALVVDAQPVRSPWWTYADADASYAASALNLVLGREVTFVDHPGLPLTEAVAIVFGVEVLLEEGSLSESARLAFVDRSLLDLDLTRSTFRGFSVLVYLLGALLSFLFAARLFGHWTWGLAAGLLWAAAPGLTAMSIQLRPDVALTVLTLVFGFTVARAVERRSPGWFATAAGVVGFAAMVKLHALALLPALAVAALWRPADAREAPVRFRRWLSRRRVLLGSVAAAWTLVAVLLNVGRLPWDVSSVQLGVFVAFAAAIVAAVAAAELLRQRFFALLIVAFAAGVLLPVTLDVPDGLRALHYIVRAISGRGVQEDVDSFATPLSNLGSIVGREVSVVFLLAAAAGVLGAFRRDPRPVVWAVGGLSMGAMAFARPPNVHYFAPTFVLAVLALLWLLQRTPRARTSLLVWPVVLLLLWPAWETREFAAFEQERLSSSVEQAKAYIDANLRPGEVALVPSYWPFEDSRYFELVEIYVEHTPDYPYRTLPTTSAVRPFAQVRRLRPRFYFGPEASDLTAVTQFRLGELGSYTLVPTPVQGLAEIAQGPGVTESW